MVARIYSPAKTAMQSGKGKTGVWVIDFEPETARQVEPLMGYTSSTDMRSQVRMTFGSKEEAVEYCTRNGVAYRIDEPKTKVTRRYSYSDNFKYNRLESWTH